MSRLVIDILEIAIALMVSTVATLGMWSFLAWTNMFNPTILGSLSDIGRIIIFGCAGVMTILIKHHLISRRFD